MQDFRQSATIAIAWCLAWGEDTTPRRGITPKLLHQMRESLLEGQDSPEEVQPFVEIAQDLFKELPDGEFPETLKRLEELFPRLWAESGKIGLVYGGATKIKKYVFEAAKLPDIRGASALLDRINLVDLPLFFGQDPIEKTEYKRSPSIDKWLDNNNFKIFEKALIPELIIYSTGGNVLAFCPPALVNELAEAIEKRYTEETLTANSCAVGATFRPLEIRFGLFQNPIENTFWFDRFKSEKTNPVVQAHFGFSEQTDELSELKLKEVFVARKNFNELVGKLSTQFNLRRSGFDQESKRSSRRYPPMLETHPYLRRDDSDLRNLIEEVSVNELPEQPKLSEPLARKRIVGQATKREDQSGQHWYFKRNSSFHFLSYGRQQLWKHGGVISWITKFKRFLKRNSEQEKKYFRDFPTNTKQGRELIQEARSLREIGSASDGFVAYIYADGNNMGQYIRDQIKTPEQYRMFSEDVFKATEQSVYFALAEHLQPHQHTPDAQSNRRNRNSIWIHPFEIVTIGGDDVLLIVPANRALAIAQCMGKKFEEILAEKTTAGGEERYQVPSPEPGHNPIHCQRFQRATAHLPKSRLSLSTGVLITADVTPIYYAEKLVSQLLKSAKKRAKDLRDDYSFYGGTVDFLSLKAVTMISSDIEAFRREGLTIRRSGQKLKLYAAPYTLHELDGLIKTVEALKRAKFPRSQLYQIRSLLERGKRTAILNYRYFRVRLKPEQQALLRTDFEAAWCEAETNDGNLAPWLAPKQEKDQTIYETLWRELVELYPFINEPSGEPVTSELSTTSEGTERETTQ